MNELLRCGAAALLVAIGCQPAMADCVVDYQTLELRRIADSDPASMLAEQSAKTQDWYTSGVPITARGKVFDKYGLPRVVGIRDVVLWGFGGTVPFMIEVGVPADSPSVIYVMEQPDQCMFQPYQVRP